MPEVWILNHYAGYPEAVPATRTFELSTRLAAQGWRVTVVACSFNHYTFRDDYPEKQAAIWQETREGVRWVFIKGAPYVRNSAARFRNMLDYSRRAYTWGTRQRAPDIIIGTSVHPFAAETARRLARRHGARFVYEVTDLWPESLVDLGHIARSSVIYQVMHRLERRAFQEASGVIGIPPKIPEYVLDSYKQRLPRFAYIPNGFAASSQIEHAAPTPDSVAYAGGFAPAHDMPTIIKAASILESRSPGRFTFNLFGDGPERAAMEAQARGTSSVKFHGLVSKTRLAGHLQANSMCLCTGSALPVHRYGISFNKLFDYFNAERPVVFAVNSGNDPVAEARAGLSVPAGDSHALAEAIQTIGDLSDRERKAMGAAGRGFLLREHHFDVLAARLASFVTEILTGEHLRKT